tara:strand:- start:11999 stop:13279 length:1281 start_codon:yes stop_codon:yes gene_type:complete
MKAVLSNRIYMNATPSQQSAIDSTLTYTIPNYDPRDPPTTIKNMGIVRKDLITLPSGREDLIPKDYEIVDKRVTKRIEFPKFKFELRPSQQEVFDRVDESCIINAWVSWGKTFTALAIASNLSQKTLVVVHTLALLKQWQTETRKVFGIEAGIIGAGKFNIDSPIVIGSVQSLYRRVTDISDEFGTVILDEMHHVSSPTFAKIVDKNKARYKIGLSGTIERKDGKHVVFRDYFGQTVHKPPKENYMTPKIDIIASDVRFMDGQNIPWATKVTHLSYQEEYVHSVAMIASAYAAKGHKVLVVSDRVEFLKTCAKLSGDEAISITGDIPHEERPKMMKQLWHDKNILYGTQSIFSEGVSLDCLSCLVLATPVNNEPLLTQLIGRIIRIQEDKAQPVVVDINLVGKTARKQANNRRGYYMKQGYEVNDL